MNLVILCPITAGSPLSFFNPYTGEATKIRIQGAAICFNADGSVADGCAAANEGYETSQIEVVYLPADDPFCTYTPDNYAPPATGNFNCEE